jgi:hypothetical protein
MKQTVVFDRQNFWRVLHGLPLPSAPLHSLLSSSNPEGSKELFKNEHKPFDCVTARLMNLNGLGTSAMVNFEQATKLRMGSDGRGTAMVRDSFDPLAAVVDWLDACRERRVDEMLNLYEAVATLECSCDGQSTHHGRDYIARYWAKRFSKAVPNAFTITNILPGEDRSSAVLDYLSYQGTPVRMHFRFGSSGKIVSTVCGPIERRSKALASQSNSSRRSY